MEKECCNDFHWARDQNADYPFFNSHLIFPHLPPRKDGKKWRAEKRGFPFRTRHEVPTPEAP